MKKLILLIIIQLLFPCVNFAMNFSQLLQTTNVSLQATKKLKEYNNKAFFDSIDAEKKLKELLEYKPDVNIHNKKDKGYTPLIYAIEAKRKPLVAMLLDAGADVKEKTSSTEPYSQTISELAALYATPEIFDLLVAHGLNIQEEGGRILFIASIVSNADLVRHLLSKYKIDPNFISKDILPPQFGSYYEQTPLLAIIKRAVITGVHGWHPTKEEKDIVAALLDAGADPFLSTFRPQGKSSDEDAFYIATHYRKFSDMEDIRNLLFANKKVKTTLANRELSHIHWRERSVDDVKQWLNDGGDPNIKTINSYTPYAGSLLGPLERMALAARSDIAKVLINAGANLDNALISISKTTETTEEDKSKAMGFLLNFGANPDARLANGDTLLIDEISNAVPSLEKIRLLLEYGANPTLKNNADTSAFDIATRLRQQDILKILSESQAKKIL